MFTGIIEATARVLAADDHGLMIERPSGFEDIGPGSSISVSGACLTVAQMDSQSLWFDVTPETWDRTHFRDFQPGDRVNLERAMLAGSRLDGHIVQGHVEGTGTVVLQKHGQLIVELPMRLLKNVVPKGSIAIEGVSLTVASIEAARITVALIPHTLEHTTLAELAKGDPVNIETDVLLRSRV